MSPVDQRSIAKKLLLLDRNIGLLKKYQKVSKKRFLDDLTLNGAALHYLVESIEIIIDIGNHILSEEFAITAENYADVIRKLGRARVISKEFAAENEEMAKFRNKIIHFYTEVDMNEVHANLQKAPFIFQKFAKYYLRFL